MQSCLFHYFEENKIQLSKVIPIKNNLIFITTVDGTQLVAKRYPTHARLCLQQEFLRKIKQVGFENTYSFIERWDPLVCNDYFVGFIEYITPHKVPFHFHTVKQRREGTELLKQFHDKTEEIMDDILNPIEVFEQTKKWQERWVEFVQNTNRLQSILPGPILNDYIHMGEWALQGLIGHERDSKGRNVIVHGDVAHHNFLRGNDGKLYLIDFDLIALAPPLIDYLQYANRVLLYNEYSLTDIFSMPMMRQFRKNRYFLYGLAFPTDIYREWNRLNRENLWNSPERIQTLWNITVDQYQSRSHYFNQVKKRLE